MTSKVLRFVAMSTKEKSLGVPLNILSSVLFYIVESTCHALN